MMPTCIDLRERFGARYRLRREADGVTWYETPEPERPWLLELPCRSGVIYPHGGSMLAAVVTGRYARQQVAALPCIRSRRGGEELVVTFPVEDAEQVLALLKPRRRRRISPEQRQRLRAMAGAASQASLRARTGQRREPGSDAAVERDPTPTPGRCDAGTALADEERTP